MAGRKKKTLDEKLADIDAKILKSQENITALKAARQKLLDDEKQKKMEQLVEIMEKQNISVDDLLAKVTEK